MKKLLLLILAVFLVSGSLFAQSSAVSYYRKVSNEKKKITKKHMKYVQVTIQNGSPRIVEKYRTMVVDQIDASIVAIKRMKPYQGDSVFRNDYIRSLKLYKEALTEGYEKMVKLEDSAKFSYDHMMLYLDAEEVMSDQIEEANLKLEKNEEYFANKFKFELIVDEEAKEENELLAAVILYTRDVYRAFYRVEAKMNEYKELKIDYDLDVREERKRQVKSAKAVELSRSDVIKLGDFEEDFGHYNDVVDMLDDLEFMFNEELVEILDLLDEGSYDERSWDKGMKKYEAFIEDLEAYTEDYYMGKEEFIYMYSPLDFQE